MGIVQVEQNRLRQQEIEVRALVALAAYGSNPQKYMACKKLEDIAHPERLADKINNYKKRPNRNYWGDITEE
tara:strand:- start:241 stop:456 length:216 start_codon:yes stop_codon:yes gene_type:complete